MSAEARDLPMGMVSDVARVLESYGLRLTAAGKQDPKVWSVLLIALGRVLDNVTTEHGGRKSVEVRDPRDQNRDLRGAVTAAPCRNTRTNKGSGENDREERE